MLFQNIDDKELIEYKSKISILKEYKAQNIKITKELIDLNNNIISDNKITKQEFSKFRNEFNIFNSNIENNLKKDKLELSYLKI